MNLLVLSIILLISFLKYRHSYWKRRGVPHEVPSFPLGDFKEWRYTKCFFEILTPIYRKFKGTAPFAGMFMIFRPVALITDPDLIQSILIKDFNHFRERGVFFNVRDDPLTGHLFALEGAKWRELRQKLSSAFSSTKLKYMYPTVVKVAEEFRKVLEEKQATAAGGVIELTDLLSRFMADIIGVCAFGIECNSLRNPQAEFVVMGKKANSERRHGMLLDTFMEAAPKLARTLRMRQTTQEVNDFYMGIVRETIELREKTGVKRNDLMDVLLELKSKGGKDGGLTVNEIAAQAFVFLIAGFETSSSTMGYVLYELAKWQDIQNRLRAEINMVLERHNNQYTYESMQDMRYLEQVFSGGYLCRPVIHISYK